MMLMAFGLYTLYMTSIKPPHKDNSFFSDLKHDYALVSHVFQYIDNYLHGFNEQDRLDMDFVVSILSFLDTFLIPIYFGREEQVIFQTLYASPNLKHLTASLNEIQHGHRAIEGLALDLAFLKGQYDKGYYLSINKIHISLSNLLVLQKDLVTKQNSLILELEPLLTSAQNKQLSQDLLNFNETIITHVIHQNIIERYKKYNTIRNTSKGRGGL